MPRALLLFSEGLDSILAGLILKREQLEVCAVKFITPFFGWKYKNNPEVFLEKVTNLGFDDGLLVDITEEFLLMLSKPAHGYGDYANPCIDCKILLLRKAKDLLPKVGADFIATGEVVGQRPMSQNRNALELIEKEAGVEGLVLRPLSAKLLKETIPEKQGLTRRDKLYDHWGRGRSFQLSLAKEFRLKEIPTPAGGCLLTDPIIGERILKVIKEGRPLNPLTAQLLTIGRHYFDGTSWVLLGRNEEENKRIRDLCSRTYPLFTLSEPSPVLAIIQGNCPQETLFSYLIRHSRKAQKKLDEGGEVYLVPVEP